MSSVPTIYALNRPQPRLGWVGRLVAGVIAAACLLVLITAARLTPDPRGMGTHLQLGMDRCGMLVSTNVPCITCGMTTSYSYLAQGQVTQSLLSQPAGTVFAVLTMMAVWVGTYMAVTGRPSARMIDRVPVTRGLFVLLGIALAGWAYKIVSVLRTTAS
jgi:Protein of unknown function (DUF2752)